MIDTSADILIQSLMKQKHFGVQWADVELAYGAQSRDFIHLSRL